MLLLLLADDRVASLAYFMLSCRKKNADAADAALHMHKDKTKKVARLQLFGHAAIVAVLLLLQLLLPVTHSLTHDLHVCQCCDQQNLSFWGLMKRLKSCHRFSLRAWLN